METNAEIPAVQPAEEKPAQPQPDGSGERTLHLTERAVAQIKEVIRAQKFEGYTLSVRVTPSGCSGLGYDLNLVKEPRAGDLTWEQDGVKIASDAMSSKYLAGTEVDYVVSLHSAGFKFQNPNAKQSCGCGSSFTT